MKKYLIILSICYFVLFFGQSFAEEGWEEEKSDHFLVYFQEGAGKDYARETISQAEKAYGKLGEKLKLRRFDYWTWDNRAKIYIYASRQAYLEGSGRQAWSGGSVDIEKKIIKCFPMQNKFFDRVLPHELTHIVFREYAGNDTELPLWLDEGMACSSERGYYQRYVGSACKLLKQDMVLHLDTLNNIGHSNLTAPVRFYVSSVSLTDYLWKEFGGEKFRKMCLLMREKNYNIEKALLEVYPFKSLKELDDQWFWYLEDTCS